MNFSSGRYFGGNDKDLGSRLPFDAGFEVVEKNTKFVYHGVILNGQSCIQ